MIKSLFRISVSVGLLGMAFGIFMGIRQDFALAPAHAHLNLLGFVTMFLSALYYRAFPSAAASRLALYQAVVSVVGAILFPLGIACVLLGGHDRFEPVVVAGALIVFAGMLLFAIIVYRSAGFEWSAAGATGDR
jgi:drug/metabolite transporter (DMT)-like permease